MRQAIRYDQDVQGCLTLHTIPRSLTQRKSHPHKNTREIRSYPQPKSRSRTGKRIVLPCCLSGSEFPPTMSYVHRSLITGWHQAIADRTLALSQRVAHLLPSMTDLPLEGSRSSKRTNLLRQNQLVYLPQILLDGAFWASWVHESHISLPW
jgi:hypothetical protein